MKNVSTTPLNSDRIIKVALKIALKIVKIALKIYKIALKIMDWIKN